MHTRVRTSMLVLEAPFAPSTLFREHGVIAYSLPSHTSGKLQSIDDTALSALKAHLRNTVGNFGT